MIIKSIPLGPVRANTYVVIDENSGHTAIIDAGDCNARLMKLLDDDRIVKIEYILLTHGHFDHINGVAELKKLYPGAKIAIHEADAPMLGDDLLSLAAGFGLSLNGSTQPDIILHDGDSLPLGDLNISVIHTPGHTKGGVTYMVEKSLFTGDTLFYCSVGRTDFPGGSSAVLNDSVCRLFDLAGDFDVYPGHDIETSLEYERHNNMYVNWRKR